MTKTDVARQYRKKWPDKPTHGLARIMYDENKLIFNSFEDARFNLRYIEGKTGDKNRKKVKDTPTFKAEARPINPFGLPESDETIYEPYIFKGHKRVAIFSDIHVPYHSMTALTAAIQFAKKEKPDALVLNGDCLDFHGLSRFEKDPRKKNFASELEAFKQLIDVFKKQLKCKIYFKLGNHDERYEKFLMQKAGELVGVKEFEFENIIKARAEGIEVIGDKRIMKFNSLNGIHGHEYPGGISTPVNIARGLFLKCKTTCFQGHNHASSEHSESDMNQKLITTWSIGCLCELHPAYSPINKWNHGFAIVDLDPNKVEFHMRNIRMKNGKIY